MIRGDIYRKMEEMMEEIITKYSGLVFSICYSMIGDYFEAEDLAQETFAAVYRKFSEFDGKNEKAWIARISVNKCKDYLKSAARRISPADEEAFVHIEDRSLQPEEQTLEAELFQKLHQLCDELDEPYGSVAKAYFLNGENASEIAERFGKNSNTVHTQIHRIRGKLRKRWEEVFG